MKIFKKIKQLLVGALLLTSTVVSSQVLIGPGGLDIGGTGDTITQSLILGDSLYIEVDDTYWFSVVKASGSDDSGYSPYTETFSGRAPNGIQVGEVTTVDSGAMTTAKDTFKFFVQGAEYGILRTVDPYGPELVSNGTFDADTDWTKQAGWTIAGGKAVATATAFTIYQNIGAEIGELYEVQFEISDYVSGTVYLKFGNGVGLGTPFSSNGIHKQIITAESATIYLDGGTVFTGKADNVSARKVL